jgi:hydrogenase expression/formation protein HypC
MQIQKIDGLIAHCCALGVERDINLLTLQDEALEVGDFVIVHLGYATQKVTEEEARSSWQLFDEILTVLQPVKP